MKPALKKTFSWNKRNLVTFSFGCDLHFCKTPIKLASSILCVYTEALQVSECSLENAGTKHWNASLPEVSAARKRDEWLLLECGCFRGKVIFSWGGDEGERKLRLLEPRLIKITSVSWDKVNHPFSSSPEKTHKPETWAFMAAVWPH